MKKLLSLTITAVLSLTLLAGCGSSESSNQGSDSDAMQSEPLAGYGSSETSNQGSDSDPMQIALLIPGYLGDKSFFDGANSAVPLIEEEFGATVRVVEMGVDVTKYLPTFIDYCEEDYDLILTISDQDDTITEISSMFPEQKFINLDSPNAPENDNVYMINVKANEMSYIAGVAAALKAEELGEDTIGFVGGMDISVINEFFAGYVEGAQYINPEIKVASAYVGSFSDSARGKEVGLVMYNSGVSVIYTAAGASGLGVIDAAKDLGKFVVGVDSDQAEVLKESDIEKSNVIITSAIKNVPGYAVEAVQRHIDGTAAYGELEYVGLKESAAGLAKNEFYEKNLSQESRDRIEEIEELLIAEEIVVSPTAGITTDETRALENAVRP